MSKISFPYKWYLKDRYPSKGIDNHKLKVFSTFACGGGSTMGYKLAGYEVIGANDIDPQMAKVYKQNHSPKHYFLCPIDELLDKELPEELYNLDILDGSPPCSTFSMAGSREKAFKKEKKFREGQAKQVLSDLFFDFLNLANKLKPKVVVAENVKGMIIGNAKAYTKQVMKRFDEIGYDCQLFLLNAATMGVPQKRERVFFIASRKDQKKDKLKLSFNEKSIPFRFIKDEKGKQISEYAMKAWNAKSTKDSSIAHSKARAGMKISDFNSYYMKDEKVLSTITAKGNHTFISFNKPIYISNSEAMKAGSYPLDYNFLDIKPVYLIGMSVPPVMTAQIAYQIYLQWFKDFENNVE
jgi:DNA (cytosine-5)-methyltransferase 1